MLPLEFPISAQSRFKMCHQHLKFVTNKLCLQHRCSLNKVVPLGDIEMQRFDILQIF